MTSTMRLYASSVEFSLQDFGQVQQWRLEAVREQLKSEGIFMMYRLRPANTRMMTITITFVPGD